jgi:hypothetical protein
LYAKDGLLGKTASWTKDEYASRASLFGTESAVACVADQPPGAASLDWLQHAGYKVHGPNFDARETLFAEFNGIYSAVRFYDGLASKIQPYSASPGFFRATLRS